MSDQNPETYSFSPWKRPVAWVTWIVLGTTVAIFLLQLLTYYRTGEDSIGDTLAFSPQAMTDHRYWTLITYAWAHAVIMFDDRSLFWLHIVSNMIPLICFGPALEEVLGHGRFLGLYLGGAVASALVWYLFNLNAGPDTAGGQGVIGASGAIFALIAAAGTVAPRAIVMVYLFYVLPIRMSLRTLALVACGIELAKIIFGWLPQVAHTAHLGGATFGFLYVLAVRFLERRRGFPN